MLQKNNHRSIFVKSLLFVCFAISLQIKRMLFLLGEFSVTITFEPDQFGRQGAAVQSKEERTLFPGASWPRSSMTPIKKLTALRVKLVCLLAEHLSTPQWFCQAAGAVLGCFLAGLSGRRSLDALALRFSTARCPFCFQVQQGSK